jgi:hypothetical protein
MLFVRPATPTGQLPASVALLGPVARMTRGFPIYWKIAQMSDRFDISLTRGHIKAACGLSFIFPQAFVKYVSSRAIRAQDVVPSFHIQIDVRVIMGR